MVVPATNVINQEVHVIRTGVKKVDDGLDIDDLLAEIEKDKDLAQDMSAARVWLAQDLPRDLAALRLSRGLSQSQLAKAVGLRQPNISTIESGARKPEYDTARKMASVLQVTTDEIYLAYENGKARL